MLAYQRVVENKGAAGVDNLSVAELKPWLKKNWRSVRQALIDGIWRATLQADIAVLRQVFGIRFYAKYLK